MNNKYLQEKIINGAVCEVIKEINDNLKAIYDDTLTKYIVSINNTDKDIKENPNKVILFYIDEKSKFFLKKYYYRF